MTTRAAGAPSADRAWKRATRAGLRWASWGAAVGSAAGLVLFAPASWLTAELHRATRQHLLLADARGSVWSGSAVMVLQGGPGSLDAAMLPGRLHWTIVPAWYGLRLTLRQPCCLQGPLQVELRPGWRALTLQLPARPDGIGQWPAPLLAGLGTPWNTLQLGGIVRLASPGLTLHMVQGRTELAGALDVDLQGATSRVSPVEPLGSYRVHLSGAPLAAGAPAGGAPATLTLTTLDGALRLSGSGQWSGRGLRFRGEARAAEGQEAGLSNLLNIIGRRQGALSVISIG
jgi:general secretion pathway protein N